MEAPMKAATVGASRPSPAPTVKGAAGGAEEAPRRLGVGSHWVSRAASGDQNTAFTWRVLRSSQEKHTHYVIQLASLNGTPMGLVQYLPSLAPGQVGGGGLLY